MREGSGASAGGMSMSMSGPAAPLSSASVASSVAPAVPAPAPSPPSDAESQAVVSALNGMLGALSETPLSPPEKKMLGDVTKVRARFGFVRAWCPRYSCCCWLLVVGCGCSLVLVVVLCV